MQNGTIVFDNNGKKIETEIINGNCKLQWKVDWAMRWFTFDVDFEMYGKDLTESAILSNKICKTLGKRPPNGFVYELFLDEKGEKISKSKGNGITIDQWLRYASPESLSLYMYQNPTRAKKLYSEVVPKAVDEYLSLIETFPNQETKKHPSSSTPTKKPLPFLRTLSSLGWGGLGWPLRAGANRNLWIGCTHDCTVCRNTRLKLLYSSRILLPCRKTLVFCL